MIIVRLMGGLGNQLQQYSLYRRLVENNIDARLDVHWFDEENQIDMRAKRKIEIDLFEGVDYIPATKQEVKKLTGGEGIIGKIRRKFLPFSVNYFNERGQMYHEKLIQDIFYDKKIKNMYLEGYFACEYYHKEGLDKLRKSLKFRLDEVDYKAELDKITDDMKKHDAISVHIRRGDYLDPVNAKMFGNICTDEYYDTCISYVIKTLERPKFYIFSDDQDFAEKFNRDLAKKYNNITSDIININHGSNSYLDIYLMSQCRANITANSTFSFWGARLNDNVDKLLLRPTIHRNDQEFDLEQMKIWWEGWKFISPEGKLYN